LTEQATGQQVDPGILQDLKMARSQRTGLRGDTIFEQTILRANAEGKIN